MKRLWQALVKSGLLSWTNLLLVLAGFTLRLMYERGLTGKSSYDLFWFIRLALAQSALYLVAAWAVSRARSTSRSTLIIVIVFAALFRLSIIYTPPFLSDDIYRYIWDGRVQAAGINPYRYIPADEHLKGLRDDAIYPKINRRDFARTIYPPLAQAIYLATTRVSESVTWMKATMVGFEVLTLLALLGLLNSMGLPLQRVLIYAWHPLIVWEIAGSGHLDSIAIAFVCLALLAYRRKWETTVGVALGCAVLVKLIPLALFPALYKRWGWRMPVAFALTIVAAYVPYLSVGINVFGYLPGYTAEEGLQSGSRFFILSLVRRLFGGANVPSAAYMIFAGLVLASLAAWALYRREDSEGSHVRSAFVLATAFTLLLSPRYEWYFAWLIPFLCFVPYAPVFALTASGFVLYLFWFGETPNQSLVVNSFLYAPFALLCALSLWRKRDAAGKRQPGTHEPVPQS
ncbi:MAG TPA: glycosyltransferase 87 family protein [Pyrinomonadaceae bacterium]